MLVELLATNSAVVAGCMSLLWLISLRRQDASIIDVFWGPGFAVVALVTLAQVGEATPRRLVLAGLTGIWGLRLGTYIFLRNRGKGEDPRYVAMREGYRGPGSFAVASLWRVFWLQAALLWLVSLPVQVGQFHADPRTLSVLSWIGVVMWLVGFLFEAIGDYQMARFKALPANKGTVMDQGLWRYTRHPNYFGNACLWWGLFLIAAQSPPALPTVLGPVLMTWLLVRVSGKDLLEKTLSKRPGYAEYIHRTSGFFPLPPRKSSG